MNYLLDECLNPQAAAAMEVLGAADGCVFRHILSIAPASTSDDAIPQICQKNDFHALITANVKDFGARKVIYEALLDSGIHVLVLRPGKAALTVFLQTSLLARHYLFYQRLLAKANQPTLATISESGVRESRISELLRDFQTEDTPRKLP